MSASLRGFRRALRGTVGQVMAYQVKDGYGATLVPLLERVLRGERVHDDELLAQLQDGGTGQLEGQETPLALAGPLIFPAAGRGGKATVLVSVRGIALYDFELQPLAFSTLLLARSMNALAKDSEVGTIVLDIDSPGGVITGVPEAADAIFAARKAGKAVVALVNPLAASAAYWLASQASEIVAVPSGETGSIGVFMLHAECAGMLEDAGIKATFIFAGEHKVEGNAIEPLSPAAHEFFQSQVDLIYRQFIKAVARGRETTQAKVERTFGRGRTFFTTEALRVGMIDRVSSIDAALLRAGVAGDPHVLRLEAPDMLIASSDPEPIEPAAFEEPDEVGSPVFEEPGPEDPAGKPKSGGKPVVIPPPETGTVELEAQPLELRSELADDGTKRVYLVGDEGDAWPECIEVSHNLIEITANITDEDRVIFVDEPDITPLLTFNLTNGRATYEFVQAGEATDIFKLREGELFEGAEALDPEALTSSRARRLAILRAG